MTNYQDYENFFRKFSIREEEAEKILGYITEIVEITIESYNEKR